MSESLEAIREHLARVLDWEEAHVGFDKAVAGMPLDKLGKVPPGFEHSAWQLVEHIRRAQDDLRDFCVKADYAHVMKWPDDYWPKDPAPPDEKAWAHSVAACRRTVEELKQIARETKDLTAPVPTGKPNQTYLRAILLVADHNAYHVGQIVAVRRALGLWK
jgi:uncharacterized damage-inducible protein DinB